MTSTDRSEVLMHPPIGYSPRLGFNSGSFKTSSSYVDKREVINAYNPQATLVDAQSAGIANKFRAACDRVIASRRPSRGATLLFIDCRWP